MAFHSFSYTLWQAWRGTLVVKGYYIWVKRERSKTRRGDKEQRGSHNGQGYGSVTTLILLSKFLCCVKLAKLQ